MTINQLTINTAKHKWWIIIAMMIAAIMSNAELTAMNLALADMGKELHLSLRAMQWILNAYLLSYASFIVTGGRMADVFGRRRIFIIGTTIFLIASLIGGFAHNTWELLVSRFLQGFGTAIGVSLITVITYTAFPEKQRALALGLLTAAVGFGLAIGPTLGGLLTGTIGWRWIFFINIPFGIIAIAIIYFLTPIETLPKEKTPIDYGGIVILTMALCSLIFAINQSEEWHWTSPALLIILVTSLLLLIAFYQHERQQTYPLLDTEILHNKKFLIGCITRFLLMYSFYVPLFILSLYMQNILGYTPDQAGLTFLAMTIVIALLSPVGGILVDQIGSRFAVLIPSCITIVTFFALAQLKDNSSAILLISILLLLGLGYGLFSPAVLRATMQTVRDEKLGAATGAFYMMSVTGGVISIAISGSILNGLGIAKLRALAQQQNFNLTRTQASDIMQQLFSSHSQQARIIHHILRAHPDVTILAHQAFMIAFAYIMYLGMAIAIVAAILVYFGLNHQGNNKNIKKENLS